LRVGTSGQRAFLRTAQFAAETIFMALVICRVLVTLRMRRRMSRTFAMG